MALAITSACGEDAEGETSEAQEVVDDVGADGDADGGDADAASADQSDEDGLWSVDPRALVDHRVWDVTDVEPESLQAHRPAEVVCGPETWEPEGGGIEVNTLDCNYLALVQPSRLGLAAGDLVRLVAWHDSLTSDVPATGHIAVSINGAVIWEQLVEIPQTAEVWEAELTMPVDAPQGSPVNFHVHNHGGNTWNLLTLEAL